MFLKKCVRTLGVPSVVLAAFLGLFAFGRPLVFAAVLPTGGTINNQAPAFTSGPDDGSTRASPTNVGVNISFTAQATDPNGEQWYLAVCKTNAITPGVDGPPTCASVPNTWAISTVTNSGANTATAPYTTLIGDSEESVWYAFACDKVASGALCSAMSNANSPFATNHRPTYSGYTATDPSGGSIEPGENIKFSVTTADTDSLQPDTVAVFVCASGNTFNGSACSGTQLCTVATTAPGAVSCTTVSTPAPIPTPAGSTNVEVFLVDSHGFVGNGTSTQSYTIANVAPTINDSSQYTVSHITTLTAGTSITKTYSVIVTDNNGDNGITAVTGVLYDDDAINLTSGTCTPNEKNCYPGVTCVLSNNADYTTPGAGTPNSYNATATCDFTVWFNANYNNAAVQGWRMHANPTDGTNSPTNLTDSIAIQVDQLAALGIVETSIAYGSLALGADSAVQTTTFQNQGNTIIDVWVQGTNMTSGTNNIPLAQQKFHSTNSAFGWADVQVSPGPGPYVLLGTSGAGNELANGCLNRDLAVRLVHTPNRCENGTTVCTVITQSTDCSGIGTQTCNKNDLDEPIYWILRVPPSQASGTYAGSNTFSSAASTSCSTATLY